MLKDIQEKAFLEEDSYPLGEVPSMCTPRMYEGLFNVQMPDYVELALIIILPFPFPSHSFAAWASVATRRKRKNAETYCQ